MECNSKREIVDIINRKILINVACTSWHDICLLCFFRSSCSVDEWNVILNPLIKFAGISTDWSISSGDGDKRAQTMRQDKREDAVWSVALSPYLEWRKHRALGTQNVVVQTNKRTNYSTKSAQNLMSTKKERKNEWKKELENLEARLKTKRKPMPGLTRGIHNNNDLIYINMLLFIIYVYTIYASIWTAKLILCRTPIQTWKFKFSKYRSHLLRGNVGHVTFWETRSAVRAAIEKFIS